MSPARSTKTPMERFADALEGIQDDLQTLKDHATRTDARGDETVRGLAAVKARVETLALDVRGVEDRQTERAAKADRDKSEIVGMVQNNYRALDGTLSEHAKRFAAIEAGVSEVPSNLRQTAVAAAQVGAQAVEDRAWWNRGWAKWLWGSIAGGGLTTIATQLPVAWKLVVAAGHGIGVFIAGLNAG